VLIKTTAPPVEFFHGGLDATARGELRDEGVQQTSAALYRLETQRPRDWITRDWVRMRLGWTPAARAR